jgi:hypothetical protein
MVFFGTQFCNTSIFADLSHKTGYTFRKINPIRSRWEAKLRPDGEKYGQNEKNGCFGTPCFSLKQ